MFCRRAPSTASRLIRFYSTKPKRVVIVGGGVSAGYAARALARQSAHTQLSVTVVANEPVLPYERPALSKGFLMPLDTPDAEDAPAQLKQRVEGARVCVGSGGEPQNQHWYDENSIRLLQGWQATAVDLDTKSLAVQNGQQTTSLNFDKLIVATGAEPVKLDAKLGLPEGTIKYLRDFNDGVVLYQHIRSAVTAASQTQGDSTNSQAVIIGGGYIGVELCAVLLSHGIKPVMICPEPSILARAVPPAVASTYAKALKEKGATILFNRSAVRGTADAAQNTTIELDDGTRLSSPLVIAGVGAQPRTGFFGDVLATEQGGIKVNSRMQTSHPDVYAVGDVATFPLPLANNALTRQEHVWNARYSAEHAVCHIAGATHTDPDVHPDAYNYVPHFYSRFIGFSWNMFGLKTESETAFTVDGDSKATGVVYTDANSRKAVGIFIEGGTTKDLDAAFEIAKAQPSVAQGVERLLADHGWQKTATHA